MANIPPQRGRSDVGVLYAAGFAEATPLKNFVSSYFTETPFVSGEPDPEQVDAGGMWQLKTKTLRDQNMYLLDNQMWTDFVFTVGSPPGDVQDFGVHRLLLAKCSPVFGQMLFGDLAEKQNAHITDIDPVTFKYFLKFIYSGELSISSLDLDLVQDICLAADKYMVLSLKNRCSEQLESEIQPATVCKLLHFANVLDLKNLKNKARRILLARTAEVLKDDSFNFATPEVILEIVQEPKLQIKSESSLISACISWASNEVARRDLPKNEDGYKEALGPILEHLRFYALTVYELGHLDSTLRLVFNVADRHAIIINVAQKKFEEIPKELCQIFKKREKVIVEGPKLAPLSVQFDYPYQVFNNS